MHTIQIPIECPCCKGQNIKKNGFNGNRKQKYFCKDCKRNFIGDHALTYQGCHSQMKNRVLHMLADHCGIRQIARLQGISRNTVTAILAASEYTITPKQHVYDCLEIDEFWTFIQRKDNKGWLIYAYCRKSKEIVAYVWGQRNLATVRKLKAKLKQLNVRYKHIASDDWQSFKRVFGGSHHFIGKQHTVGIEGNNCALRHLVSRATRRSCCFSKKQLYHEKAFDLCINYLNNRRIFK